jgi:hypothetical protein
MATKQTKAPSRSQRKADAKLVHALRAAVFAYEQTGDLGPLRQALNGAVRPKARSTDAHYVLRAGDLDWPAVRDLAVSGSDDELSSALTRWCELLADVAWPGMYTFEPDPAALVWIRDAARKRAGVRRVVAYLGRRVGADGIKPMVEPSERTIGRFREALRAGERRTR